MLTAQIVVMVKRVDTYVWTPVKLHMHYLWFLHTNYTLIELKIQAETQTLQSVDANCNPDPSYSKLGDSETSGWEHSYDVQSHRRNPSCQMRTGLHR